MHFFYLHQTRVSALAVKLLADKGALRELSIFTKRCSQSCTTPFPVRSKQKFWTVPGLVPRLQPETRGPGDTHLRL